MPGQPREYASLTRRCRAGLLLAQAAARSAGRHARVAGGGGGGGCSHRLRARCCPLASSPLLPAAAAARHACGIPVPDMHVHRPREGGGPRTPRKTPPPFTLGPQPFARRLFRRRGFFF